MTEPAAGGVPGPPPPYGQPGTYAPPPYGQPGSYAPVPMPYPGGAVVPYLPVGKIRSTGVCILLAVVTLGIYVYVWYFMVHDEMQRHTGRGIGGGVALLLAFFVGIVMPFLSSSEVGGLYEARGERKPVGGATGLWYFPGALILIGPLVWFIRTNAALNSYWRSLGAR